MCSKTRSEDDYSGLCRKKQKHNGRRRVPRRGPGVAELEKIRLEEQHNNSTAAPLPPVYPVSSYLTTGSFPYDLIPPAPVFEMKHDPSLHYLPPPMNPPNPGSGGFYQFTEPPSTQTSLLDEEKIVAAKRPCHFILETAKCSISRDATQTRSVDLRLKNHFQELVTTNRNPITIDSPTPIIPNSPLDFPPFIQKQEFDSQSMPRKSGANLSLNRKPFYSFLPSNDQDPSFSFKTQRCDTPTDHAIDLRLKL